MKVLLATMYLLLLAAPSLKVAAERGSEISTILNKDGFSFVDGMNGPGDHLTDILTSISRDLDAIVTLPKQATGMIETFLDNQGFAPHGIRAEGREKVLSYMWSLQQAFGGLQVYLGTERGEYFAYYNTDAIFRQPGESGYLPDDPVMSKFYNVCTDGSNGEKFNCTMSEGNSYVQCEEDCHLVPCSNQPPPKTRQCPGVLDECPEMDKVVMCPEYTIQKVQPNRTLGYVPLGYHCINEYGMFNQTPGHVLKGEFDGHKISRFYLGQCNHWDESVIVSNDFVTADFPSCGGDGQACDTAYVGLMRTVDYDPRLRPWYISTKEKQRENWGEPYPFVSPNETEIGITYANPFYSTTKDGTPIFEGVFAVDYSFRRISRFFMELYGDRSDVAVLVAEAAAPHYLIATSTTENNMFMDVKTNDPLVLCEAYKGDEECTTVRVAAADLGTKFFNNSWHKIASKAIYQHSKQGFRDNETVLVKEDDNDLEATTYVSQAVRYSVDDLNWIIIAISPMEESESNTIERGEVLFAALILVSITGFLLCAAMLTFWYKNRNTQPVKEGDFALTAAFIIGCMIMNLASLTSLGANTDAMCMLRWWTFNLSFSLAVAPLLAKVYRLYQLIGSARLMRRKRISVTQATLWTIPIIGIQVLILLVFSFLDPPRAVEFVEFDDSGDPLHSIQCQQQSDAFFFTDTIYHGLIVLLGCVLSFLTRNIDERYGEARQLLFGMYNVAITGIIFLSLNVTSVASPEALRIIRSIGIFWVTTVSCGVFVIPRLLKKKVDFTSRRSRSSSGFFFRESELTETGILSAPLTQQLQSAQHPPRRMILSSAISSKSSSNRSPESAASVCEKDMKKEFKAGTRTMVHQRSRSASDSDVDSFDKRTGPAFQLKRSLSDQEFDTTQTETSASIFFDTTSNTDTNAFLHDGDSEERKDSDCTASVDPQDDNGRGEVRADELARRISLDVDASSIIDA